MDVHEPAVRSYNMSRIRSKDTKPEMIVRKFLFSKGLRFRIHNNKLPGKPDIILPKHRTIINIHGCFWHGHKNCAYFVIPKTRTNWWLNKIDENKTRDLNNKKTLATLGWKIITIWECQLKSLKIKTTLAGLLNKIENES